MNHDKNLEMQEMNDDDKKILEEGDAYIAQAYRVGTHFPATDDGCLAVTYVPNSPRAPWHNPRYNALSMIRHLSSQISYALDHLDQDHAKTDTNA